MGVDRTIYLGPAFMACTQKTRTDLVEKRWLCDNAKCPDFNHGSIAAGKERRKVLPMDAQFCTKCGHPSIIKDIVTGQEEKETPTLSEVDYALGQAGFESDHLWIHDERWSDIKAVMFLHNGLHPPPRKFKMDTYESQYLPKDKIDIDAELDWFTDKFREYYKVLQACYGEKYVSVVWGLFTLVD